MKKLILKISKNISKRKKEAFYNRINWMVFFKNLMIVFNELKSFDEVNKVGTFYLDTNANEFDEKILYFNRVNQAQIRIGNTILPYHTLTPNSDKKCNLGNERGASLVFSQFVNGKISIFLYPQKSEFMSEKREFLILAWGKNPNDLTENEIRKYVKTYLKHIYATGSYTAFDVSNYFHRTKLLFIDALITRFQKLNIMSFTVSLFTVIGALATVIGTWFALRNT